MPVAEIPYVSRGQFQVVVVALDGLGKRHFHFTRVAGEEESWALRDYQNDMILRSGPSSLTASQIEARVTHAARPALRSTERKAQWAADLKQISERHFGQDRVDTASPPDAPDLGKWRKMSTT